MQIEDMTGEQKLSLAGAGAVAVGAFLPWFRFDLAGSTVTQTGLDLDGWLTLGLAVAAIAAVLAGGWQAREQAVAFVAGFGAGILAAVYLHDPFVFGYEGPEAGRELTEAVVSPAPGLYLTLAGGIAIVAGAGLALNATIVADFGPASSAE